MSKFDEINFLKGLYLNPIIDDIYDEQKEDKNELLRFIANLILIYLVTNDVMKMSYKDKIMEFNKANKLIDKILINEGKLENNNLTDILKSIPKKRDFEINKKEINSILNKVIEAKTYSDRIWDNKNKVAKVLKNEVKRLIDGKTSVNDIKDKIEKVFNVNKNISKRLVEHEISRVNSEVNEKYFIENGIDKVRYVAKLDNTCEVCLSYDGEVYNVNDEDRPKLPTHINCKCFYAVANDERSNLQQEQIKITNKNIDNSYTVNRKLVNSKEYHDKFEEIPLNKRTRERLYIESKAILEHRNSTELEDLVILDANTGNEIVSNKTSNNTFKTGLTKEDYGKVINHNGELILLHNHPGGGRLSGSDIISMYKNNNVKMSVVVAHDGSLHYIFNMYRKINIEEFYNLSYNEYKKQGYPVNIAKLKATDDLYESNLFTYIVK
ncbi:phage putative head morphogenesis protein, SPP1 gp7 family [Clostridium cavendishii DSM 21758]|uniref:Phage putative head morphogenesis protein, SPP1 gp7 family n=1 Tax=Clostridium cavendishii DSM 21758 TaxID=1121302 RepID=A0A1M6S3I3_9CLOT|nr:minor capsid protein [Clostridium cavendishii]SHK39189.1 phage putative head morphogenesis protein, SPP1 gp7 family [Clostridium cavendishii DSM 21758]